MGMLDDFHGWQEDGNEIHSIWPCENIDPEQESDWDAYWETLDPVHVKILPGQNPVKILITLPNASQKTEASNLLFGMAQSKTVVTEEVTTRMFQSCVRFPELEVAKERPLKMKKVGRRSELPDHFMSYLVNTGQGAMMVHAIGGWIYQRSFLTDQEKKASSPESTKKTSDQPASGK
jgi:hypothetical protein